MEPERILLPMVTLAHRLAACAASAVILATLWIRLFHGLRRERADFTPRDP
ncbi:MAG TPA: hypothetical protein VMI74_03040 [Burkholderiales bacterium]|nr:hypothetical protein [Burkholderiales bacterium]